jgi:hypothetical protein
VAGAPGSLSMAYLPFWTDMMGTPGTLRILLLRSRSFAVMRVSIKSGWDKKERRTYWQRCRCGVFGYGRQCTKNLSAWES